jgi:hypothetical protein
MVTKLTIKLDEGVIREAKQAARMRGVSLSDMVSGYFKAIARKKTVKSEATPVLAEISGILNSKANAKKLLSDYRKHREGKYR